MIDHFDTAEYVTRLEKQGLDRQQAEGVIDTLEDIIGEAIQTMQGNLVTRAEQEKVCSPMLQAMRGQGVRTLTSALARSITISKRSVPVSSRAVATRDELTMTHFRHKQVDFASLKQTLELSEKTDFVNLKAENERLLGDIERLKQRLREEITRTQAGVRLDLNLEKVSQTLSSRRVTVLTGSAPGSHSG